MSEDIDTLKVKEDHQAPVWARSDAFPEKPSGSLETGAFSLYGFLDVKGNEVRTESASELCDKVGTSKHGIDMVWGPQSDYLIAPEEMVELRPKLWQRRSKWARGDLGNGKQICLVFGLMGLWSLFNAYRVTGDVMTSLQNPTVGIIAILILIFGLMPIYEGWKVLRKGKFKKEEDWQGEIAESRFDSWLSKQKSPVTSLLLVVMIITGLSQLYLERSISWTTQSVAKAGLMKNDFESAGSEWWRFLTAPLLHGNLLHWLMNAAAIRYLGARVESLARWPHLVMVIVFSAAVGGYFTFKMVDSPSVGASGGIMGLLGFLLVFELLHSKLVPKPTRRRLIVGVVVTALMGVLGFRFIDNAAHLGGLVAGMVYAGVIFPSSKSPQRPRIMKQDRMIAVACGAVIVVGLVILLMKLF